MKVIKKDGRVTDFLPDKIKTSIENAAHDSGIYLNSSDINLIINETEHVLVDLERDRTSSYEIKSIIYDILKKRQFTDVAKSYILY